MGTVEQDRRWVVQVYDSAPIVMTHAENIYLFDQNGKRYIDCSGQYSACSLGHNNTELIDALKEQLDRLVSVNIMFMTQERAELAEKLACLIPEGKYSVLLGVTGSDANEFALKVAKYYRKGGKILSFWRGFHGSTAGSAAATGKSESIQRDRYISELLPQGFIHASPPYCSRCDFDKSFPSCNYFCLTYLEKLISHEGGGHLSAVMIEPVMASGGVIIPPEGYFEKLQEITHRHNALLILDEVVTGIGRTGTMFAFEQWNISPDIVVVGKALTGGYIPGSAVIVKEEIAEFMQDIVLHGHTHTAYPLMCCSALKNLEIINRENILTHVRKAGTYFLKKLTELSQRYESIGEVRGRGLLLGIDIVRNGQPDYLGSRQLTEKLLENGLIVELECFPHLETAVLVFHPPLIITEQQIEDIVGIMERVLDAPEDE